MKTRGSRLLMGILAALLIDGGWSSARSAGVDPAALAEAVAHLQKICKRRAQRVQLWSVAGRDGWLFMDEELAHLAAGRFWGQHAIRASRVRRRDERDPLPAILDYRDRLRALGIELILFPVPPKAIIYPDMLVDMTTIPLLPDGRLPRLDPEHQAFYALLREHGLTVFDPTEILLQNRFGVAGPMYCKQDHHYSGQAVALLAPRLAALIKEQAWYKALPAEKRSGRFESEQRDVQIAGDLWQTYRLKVKQAPEREVLRLAFIGRRDAGGQLQPIPDDPESPVLIFGGSHALVFHVGGDLHASGAGLADHLARELGFAVDVIATRGDMTHNPRVSILRRARENPASIRAKKVFIWVFSARAFTVGRWRSGIQIMPDGK